LALGSGRELGASAEGGGSLDLELEISGTGRGGLGGGFGDFFGGGFFGRGGGEFAGADEAGVAADLAEAEEGLEDVEALGVEIAGAFHAEEEGAGAFELGVVEGALGAFEFDDEFFLNARGEVAGDLGFGAAEEEVFHALGEARAGGGVGLVVVEAFEGGLAAEEAGLGEGEEAPEIEEAVFDGGAGEDEAVRGAEGAGGGGGGAGGVFDVLAFVEDDGVPGFGGEGFGVEAELGVVGD
jgi:hypothetical protein